MIRKRLKTEVPGMFKIIVQFLTVGRFIPIKTISLMVPCVVVKTYVLVLFLYDFFKVVAAVFSIMERDLSIKNQ